MKKWPIEWLLSLTFCVLILAGALLMGQAPFVPVNGLSLVDRLFTATSAVCVTGLMTQPLATFDRPGQILILFMIQLGGIGIMTLTSSVILLIRGKLDLPTRLHTAQVLEGVRLAQVPMVLWTILVYTLVVEFLGTLVLAAGFRLDGASLSESLYLGCFHAVSAFCNAGFSPLDQSLVQSHVLVQTGVALLIVFGGLGAYIAYDCVCWCRDRRRPSLHSRVTLLGSLVLITVGGGVVYWLEQGRISLADAFFLAITARTAGFYTLSPDLLQPAALVLIMFLMLIGAAPGSTGGGMKLTTVFLVAAACIAAIRGRNRVVAFRRKLGPDLVNRAFVLFACYLMAVWFSTLLLLFFEGADLLTTLFEAISAMGTVGLTLGLTAEAGTTGKLVLIGTMLVGRLGPALLAMQMCRLVVVSHIDYPEEQIILG